MPEDNRFAGLSEAVEEDDPSGESDDGSDTVPPADVEPSDDGESTTEVEYESAESDADTDRDTEANEPEAESSGDTADADDPTAFPFDATEKKTVYVRPETLDDLEDARALVDAQLRTRHDVRDLTGREFYDAAFRLAAADTSGLIDEILEARDE